MFYDKNECGGSSRWLVAPSTVKVFIKGILLQEKTKWKGEVEGLRKVHHEFECNGAHNGKGCYECWCDDQNCRNAPKEYNQAIDEVLKLLNNDEEI